MDTKLVLALLGTFFLVNQSGFAGDTPSQSAVSAAEVSGQNDYLPYLQFGGTKFFNVDSAKAGVDANVFAPLWQKDVSQLVFAHLRFFDRTGKPFEGNAHVGYRHLVPEKEHMYGIYGAFDRKRSEFGNYFNQLTLGAEGWFQKVFVGGNLYQPVGNTSNLVSITNEKAEFDRVQNSIWITADKQHEKAMGG